MRGTETQLAVEPNTHSPAQDAAKLDAARPVAGGVVVIGNDFQALGILRALHEAGIETFLLAPEAGIARRSRFAKRSAKSFQFHQGPPGETAQYLQRLARREGLEGWAIFCVADETVEFLAKQHAELSESFLLPLPDWDKSQHFFHKDLSYLAAMECGLPVPKHYPFQTLEELLAQEPEYPLVLKPTFKKNYYEKTNDKAVLVENREQLTAEFEKMRELIPAEQILAQEFIPGGPKNLYSYATVFDGERVVCGLSANRLRQHPMDFGHATTYAEARDIPALEEAATKLLRRIRFRGVAEVEFMFDPRSKEYKFLEINGRFWGWHSLTFTAGLNVPRDLFLMLQGKAVPESEQRLDATWVRTLTDAPTVLREIIRGRMTLSDYLRTLKRRKACAVWSWKDPIPFLAELLIAPYLWWKKGF